MIDLENTEPNISKKEGIFIIEFPLKSNINKIIKNYLNIKKMMMKKYKIQ